MSYQEREQPASLGGVDLLVTSIESEDGRRTTSIEYPDRDRPSHQDHGRSASRWSVEAVVLGGDFDLAAAELRALARRKGPHTWVHPWTGEILVVLDGAMRIAIDRAGAEGGARATFRIVESGDGDEQLLVATATDAALVDAADVMGTALAANLEAQLDVSAGGSTWARARAAVASAATQAAVTRGKVASVVNAPSAVALAVDTLADEVDALAAAPGQLVASLRSVAAATFDLLEVAETAEEEAAGEVDTVAAGTRAKAVAEVVADSAAWDPTEEEGDPATATQATNDGALRQAGVLSTLGEASAVLAGLALDTADTAVELLDTFAAIIAEELEAEWTGDDLYGALVELRAALDEHLQDLAGRLPQVTTIVPADTVPALLHSYSLYGDVEREQELLARNRVINPAAVPGGRELEVLVDAG